MEVALISPINNFAVQEFSYNPDEINYFSMSRVVGLGLSLIKNNELENDSANRGFIVQDFTFDKNIKYGNKILKIKLNDPINSPNKTIKEINKIKNQEAPKIKLKREKRFTAFAKGKDERTRSPKLKLKKKKRFTAFAKGKDERSRSSKSNEKRKKIYRLCQR